MLLQSGIVSYRGTQTGFRLRSAVLMFGAAVVLLLGPKVALPWCEASPVHAHHAISASVDRDLAFANHHVQHEFICSSDLPDAAAVLPRIAPLGGLGFIAMTGIAMTGIVIAGWLAAMMSPVMRGPPGRLAASLTGRQVLSRLCIARR